MLGNDNDDKVIEKDAVIVDVRSKNEFASGHLQGAVNIPLEQVDTKADDLKRYVQIVVYCRSGNRSAHARKLLIDRGLTNVIDAGSLADAKALLVASGVFKDGLIKEAMPDSEGITTLNKDENVLKILIPTDFSVQADFSYLMAIKLEEHLSVDIHFLHVMDVPDTVTIDASGTLETCGEIDVQYIREQKKIAETKLQYLQMQYGKHVSVHLLFGKVTDSILSFAESNKYDLIVMGTKGAWGIKEKVSTSQAQIIARMSKVPLLSLMCDRSDLIIREILYVHDFMEKDNSVIPLMHKFSKYFDATYHQLFIYKDDSSLEQEKLLVAMDKYASEHGIGKHKNHFIEASSIEDGVNKFLKSQDVDMVFIGTHGKGGFFHNSGAENLIKHLFKPIISFQL
jgi:rhodanese-related sulfurtransferase/nucleotide-binding universal stress UspA family protein